VDKFDVMPQTDFGQDQWDKRIGGQGFVRVLLAFINVVFAGMTDTVDENFRTVF